MQVLASTVMNLRTGYADYHAPPVHKDGHPL